VPSGWTTLLHERPPGEPVPLSEVRTQASQHDRGVRIAEVLADVELLNDDTCPWSSASRRQARDLRPSPAR
jgi:hypothetical protein